jgi:hypothetical protein
MDVVGAEWLGSSPGCNRRRVGSVLCERNSGEPSTRSTADLISADDTTSCQSLPAPPIQSIIQSLRSASKELVNCCVPTVTIIGLPRLLCVSGWYLRLDANSRWIWNET